MVREENLQADLEIKGLSVWSNTLSLSFSIIKSKTLLLEHLGIWKKMARLIHHCCARIDTSIVLWTQKKSLITLHERQAIVSLPYNDLMSNVKLLILFNSIKSGLENLFVCVCVCVCVEILQTNRYTVGLTFSKTMLTYKSLYLIIMVTSNPCYCQWYIPARLSVMRIWYFIDLMPLSDVFL